MPSSPVTDPVAQPIKYVVGALAVAVMALGVATATRGSGHPSPRTGLTAAHVESAEHYIAEPDVAAVYQAASEIPDVLDGLYCHCDCSKHHGHRSLLTCFQTEHGAACDACLQEAQVAYKMTKEGKSLKEIRKAIDDMYS